MRREDRDDDGHFEGMVRGRIHWHGEHCTWQGVTGPPPEPGTCNPQGLYRKSDVRRPFFPLLVPLRPPARYEDTYTLFLQTFNLDTLELESFPARIMLICFALLNIVLVSCNWGAGDRCD